MPITSKLETPPKPQDIKFPVLAKTPNGKIVLFRGPMRGTVVVPHDQGEAIGDYCEHWSDVTRYPDVWEILPTGSQVVLTQA